MSNETLAKFFYDQLAGTTSGHMAAIPNNPVMWGLLQAQSGSRDNLYAITKADFAEFLRGIADSLDGGKTSNQGTQLKRG